MSTRQDVNLGLGQKRNKAFSQILGACIFQQGSNRKSHCGLVNRALAVSSKKVGYPRFLKKPNASFAVWISKLPLWSILVKLDHLLRYRLEKKTHNNFSLSQWTLKKVWTLFSLLNMQSPKVQKVSHWLSKIWKTHHLLTDAENAHPATSLAL